MEQFKIPLWTANVFVIQFHIEWFEVFKCINRNVSVIIILISSLYV